MRSLLSFQIGGPPGSDWMAHVASALALVSRSIAAYTLVVSTETWPSHARMVLMSTPARRRCVAVVCLCSRRHRRHSAAMELLQHGVDRSVIALWLGHEPVETTQMYLRADLRLKEHTLAHTAPLAIASARYRPADRLLALLESL